MRIAYFTESLFPHVDGVSRTLGQLFATLEAEALDFRVYAPFQPDASVSWSPRVRRVRSIAFPLYTDYRVSLPGLEPLGRELDAYRPDVVHVVSPTPMAVWAQRYARRRRLPVVASFHTHFVSYFRYYRVRRLERLGWWLLRRFYRRCDAVFAPSHAIIRELERHGIPDVELWSRGIDLRRFGERHRDDALRAAVGADERTPLVLMVSRLVREKDLADLAAAHRLLCARGVAHRLVLVGDGPMRRELQAALPDAHFAGHQVGAELARWYASADVFVFPSTTETFGNVVLEALASGVPAVVVDRGGPADLVDHRRTGMVAAANDPVDLARCIEALLADPAARREMGRRAAAAAVTRDWAEVNRALLDGYRRVVDQARRPARLAGAAA